VHIGNDMIEVWLFLVEDFLSYYQYKHSKCK